MIFTFGTFRIFFLAGLALACTAIAFVLANNITLVVSVTYLLLAVLHILLLAAIGMRMNPVDRGGAPVWLYTAGFLHTLIALGVAIATAGIRLREIRAENLVAELGTILVPMGTAVLPHFLGVLAGQFLEQPRSEQPGQIYEAMVERLTLQAEQGVQSLGTLFARREALLKQEVDLLERQVKHWQQSEQSIRAMIARVNTLSDDLEQAGRAANGLRGSLDTASQHARTLAPALQEATRVVGDLRKLQESIVDLLSQSIFHRR